MTTPVSIPLIETERLTLRAPRDTDFSVYREVLMSSRAQYIGGPFSEQDAWYDFAAMAGSWVLRGYGPFAIETKADQQCIGISVLHHEHGDPEPELGWIIAERHEGQGYASEAAKATLDFAVSNGAPDRLVSYIDAQNDASIRVAEKLGARRDDAATHPMAVNGDVLTYRHIPKVAA